MLSSLMSRALHCEQPRPTERATQNPPSFVQGWDRSGGPWDAIFLAHEPIFRASVERTAANYSAILAGHYWSVRRSRGGGAHGECRKSLNRPASLFRSPWRNSALLGHPPDSIVGHSTGEFAPTIWRARSALKMRCAWSITIVVCYAYPAAVSHAGRWHSYEASVRLS